MLLVYLFKTYQILHTPLFSSWIVSVIIYLTPVFPYATTRWWTSSRNIGIIVEPNRPKVDVDVCYWTLLTWTAAKHFDCFNFVCICATSLIGQITNMELLPIAFMFQTTAKSKWDRNGNKVDEKWKRTKLHHNAMQIQHFNS